MFLILFSTIVFLYISKILAIQLTNLTCVKAYLDYFSTNVAPNFNDVFLSINHSLIALESFNVDSSNFFMICNPATGILGKLCVHTPQHESMQNFPFLDIVAFEI